MQVTCSECQKVLNIPDEKIPSGGRFTLKCPYCEHKMLVEGAPAAEEAPQRVEAPKRQELELPAVEPDVFPPGANVAFLYLTDGAWRAAAGEWFADKGYHVGQSTDELEAIAKLRLNRYDVLVIEDSDAAQRLLQEVAEWPGHKRRATNLILLGDQSKSLDPNLAFRKGANFYMNTGDKERASELLENVIQGYELYYQLFNKATQSVEP